MSGWDDKDLITESLSPSGTDYDGDWQGFYGMTGTAELESTIVAVGNNSIKLGTDGGDYIYCEYQFDSLEDFSDFDYIVFWIKVRDEDWDDLVKDDPSYAPMFIMSASGPFGQRSWGFIDQLPDSGWHKIVLRLDQYDATSIDCSSVKYFRLYFSWPNSGNFYVYVDGIHLIKTRKWTGGGADENWATAGNWEGSNIPNTVEEAPLFTGAESNKDCTIQVGDTVPGGFGVESDYEGTITIPGAGWGDGSMLAEIEGGTIVGGQLECMTLSASGCTITDLKVRDAEDFDPEYISVDPSATISHLAISGDQTVHLQKDLSAGTLSLGTGGDTHILDLDDKDISCSDYLRIGDGQADVDIVLQSGSSISLNENESPYVTRFGNETAGTQVSVGTIGGLVWDFSDGGSEIHLGDGSVLNDVSFYGPRAGGSLQASGATVYVHEGAELYSYGGDVYFGSVEVGSGGVLDIGGGILSLYGDMISEGSVTIDPDTVVNIYSENNVLISGIDVWNINVDSDGNGITVTASGCTMRGSIDVASGDDLKFAGGTVWEQAKVKWTGEGSNNNWSNSDNWQNAHVPEADDTAWFDGSGPNSIKQCNINGGPTIPTAIEVGPDFKGSDAKIVNLSSDWGGPYLDISVYGTQGNYFLLDDGTHLYFRDIYVERGYMGVSNGKMYVYGDIDFSGDRINWVVSTGTDDRTWSFDTDGPEWEGGRAIGSMFFEHHSSTITLTGTLHVEQYFQFQEQINDDLEVEIDFDGDLYLYNRLLSDYPWQIHSHNTFLVASGNTISHLEDFYGAAANFTTGGPDDNHRRFEWGEPSGYWNFEGYPPGSHSYGGYGRRLYWGHVIGMMPRWHCFPHYPEYAKFYGPAPGYSWVAHNSGLHIGTSGQFLSFGGDIETVWFEVTPGGYFDQGTSKLTVTGKAITGDKGPPWAPGEPDMDHKWAIWSTGTWVWSPGASIYITADEDVELWDCPLPDLHIDSGGNNITVTASGCTFYGEPTIADGDRLVILGGSSVLREVAPDLGITKKEGDYLVTELDIEMEGD